MIKIDIETSDNKVLSDLFEGTKSWESGKTRIENGNYSVFYEGTYIRLGADYPSIIHIGVDLLKPVAISLFSAWLYDKLKNREIKTLKIGGRQVEINLESIRYNLKT